METKYQIIYNYLLPLMKWINDDSVNEIMINRKDDIQKI
jgi:type IV secretory pathway ATPase VirB11/archaellum biosynthesis ATPase